MPLAAEGHILVAVNLFVMTIAPGAKKSSMSANIYADRFCRHRTNPEPRLNNVDYELLCRERDNFRILVPSLTRCFPAWIWTNWSAKSPRNPLLLRH